jgi:hypothetical protein
VKEPLFQVPLTELSWREMLHFWSPPSTISQSSHQTVPPPPPLVPYGERHPSREPSPNPHLIIQLSLTVPVKGAPSMFPNKVPMVRDTPSPEPVGYSFICQSPLNGALPRNGKKTQSPSTEPHADGRPTYNGLRSGSPKGIVNDAAITTPVACCLRHDIFHLDLGRSEPR